MTKEHEEELETIGVSKAELSAGVKVKAGHKVVLLLGGVPGRVITGDDGDADSDGTGSGDGGDGSADGSGDATGGDSGGGEENGTGDGGDGTGAGPDTPDAPVTKQVTGHLDLQVVSVAGAPQADLEVELTLPDGSKRAGKTDKDGAFHVDQLPEAGECKLEIPDVAAPAEAGAPGAGRVRYAPGVALPIGASTVVELPPRVRRGTLTGMHFETNKTFLRPSSMAGIRQLRALYESFGSVSLLITGHTDTVGLAEANRGLSVERAESIAAFLTDDADAWAAKYAPQPHSSAWGVREDQYMLSALPEGQTPYYTSAVDGQAGSGTSAAYQRFQGDKGLPQSGKGDAATRKALIAAYMALDGTSLPAGSTVLTHGCGLTHLAEPTGPNTASEANRRVEMFLFDAEATPPPQTPCPAGGCAEYPQWVAASSLTIDLDKPPGGLAVTVVDADTKAPIEAAEVHAAGPTPHDAKTGADGVATFDVLVPGHYKVIVDESGFAAADAEVDVAEGATGALTLSLKALPPMEITDMSGGAATQAEIDAFKQRMGK